jgi:hypothetical protein
MKDSYDHLLSGIYDLVLAPTDWPIVLRLLAEALNSPCAASVITTPERDTPRSLGVVGITPDDHCAFLHTWHKRKARPAFADAQIIAEPSTARRLRRDMPRDRYSL